MGLKYRKRKVENQPSKPHKTKKGLSLGLLMCALVICCSVDTVLLAMWGLVPFLIAISCLAVVVLILLCSTRRLRRLMASLLHGREAAEAGSQFHLENMTLPVAILAGKRVAWYNPVFGNTLLGGEERYLESIYKVLPGFDAAACMAPGGLALEVQNRKFTVYGALAKENSDMLVIYLTDDTALKNIAQEYGLSRPSVLHITLDTYDELKKELKESERARITGEIDLALERYVGKTSGFLLRTGSDRYVAVMEERHIRRLVEERFDILDRVRELGGEYGVTTLSIGVGRGGKTLAQCEEMASDALDMALGRGGDQAAVKSDEGFVFYGGVSRSVEKRNKVKARIIATALVDLLKTCDSAIIMGHRLSDMDAIGAAVGVHRICQQCGVPACIAVNERTTLAGALVKRLKENGFGDDMMDPEKLLSSVTPHTLLVIVDTHMPGLVESRELYEACKTVVVIDHHRRMVGHIDNAVITYHEPYASSACELVSEVLQYVLEKDSKLLPVEAQALLSGIMLDTREFSVHTGVRTFEAAAWLRRMGAQTVEVKKLFAGTINAYKHKAALVTAAKIYKSCAISASGELPEEMRVVIPQAANDLLEIEDVGASFVAVEMGDMISISARSMGEINVQVIMENLGGGGHLTMAGAQLKDTSLEEAWNRLVKAIDTYWENSRKEGNKA